MEHWGYLLVAVVTHGLVGYALVRAFTSVPPAVGALGAVAPDVDLLFDPSWQFPVVHRGITHTPALLVVVVLVLAAASSVAVAGAFGVGALSHLLVDSVSPAGVMWLYPVNAQPLAADLPVHGTVGTVLLWSGGLALLGWARIEKRGDPSS